MICAPMSIKLSTKNNRINGKAPIRAKAMDGIGWGGKLLHLPVAEHAGLAIQRISPVPNVQPLVRVTRQVVFLFVAQVLRQVRIVAPVDFDHHGVARRIVTPQQNINRVGRFAGVPAKPQFRSGLADRRAQQVQRTLA